jgi:hypothetical protein
VGKPLEVSDLHDHLMGVRTYGSYVMDAGGFCRFAVFDADTLHGLETLWTLQQDFASQGIASHLEASRRGGHLWLFFTMPARASEVRAWLHPFWKEGLELYPKQDEGKGYGSLIRLPLGVHRRSGKRYPFVRRDPSGIHRVATTIEETLAWLATVERVTVPHEQPPMESATPHTSFSPPPPSPAPRSPITIRQWCALHDPFDVIGRYVNLSHAGVGRCPFSWHHAGGHDSCASFKVYRPGVAGGYCWYCYAWQQGGSVFDFFRYYYQRDARSLWRDIQQGLLSV